MTIAHNQAWPERAPIMKELFTTAFGTKAVKGLEIGVWYGVGSTQIWLQHCGPNSEFYLIDSWKPYSSHEDLTDDTSYNYKEMDDLSTDAFLSAFLATKSTTNSRSVHNIKSHLIRGESSSCLSAFSSDQFDFIYIDGDHKYKNVSSDIKQAKRLIRKDFGIICGDDLEFLPTEDRYSRAKKFPNRDFLRDPGSECFHPGVLAAVYEEFGIVNMVNGFWWTVCLNSNFTTEAIKPG